MTYKPSLVPYNLIVFYLYFFFLFFFYLSFSTFLFYVLGNQHDKPSFSGFLISGHILCHVMYVVLWIRHVPWEKWTFWLIWNTVLYHFHDEKWKTNKIQFYVFWNEVSEHRVYCQSAVACCMVSSAMMHCAWSAKTCSVSFIVMEIWKYHKWVCSQCCTSWWLGTSLRY